MAGKSKRNRYEEFVFALGFTPDTKSLTIKEWRGAIIQSIGGNLTLLEILAANDFGFDHGERIPIGKANKRGFISILEKLEHSEF